MSDIDELCEDIALVIEVNSDSALVELEKKDTCKSCSASMFCMGSGSAKRFSVKTTQALKPGDRVKLNITSGTRLFSSFVVFILPVILMIIFYVGGKYLFTLSEDWSVFSAIIGLLFSGFIIILVDRKLGGKLKIEVVEKL